MATTTADTAARIAEWSDGAFRAFCDDVAGMFDVDMQCERREVRTEQAAALENRFGELSVSHLVHAEGTLDGTFHLLFDQGGLFVLSGVVVMLPDNRILEHVQSASMEEAMNLQDAAREVGNLLVGSWDRVFRDDCKGHEHFKKGDTSLGQLWDAPEGAGLPEDDEVVSIVYEMTVGSYPSFRCAAVFPLSLLACVQDAGQDADVPAPAEPSSELQTPEATPQEEAVGEAAPEPPADAAPDRPTDPPAGSSVGQHKEAADHVDADGQAPATEPAAPSGGQQEADPLDTMPLPSEIAASARQGGISVHGPSLAFIDPAHVQSSPSDSQKAGQFLDMRAAEIMRKEVVWADPEETVGDVAAKMQQHNVGHVLVGRKGQLEGLATKSDILAAVSLYLRPMFAKWRRPEDDATLRVKVKWIMSRPVPTVRPDTTLSAIVENLCRYGGSCLPVVDSRGLAQGMITMHEILLRILELDGNIAWKGTPPQAPILLS